MKLAALSLAAVSVLVAASLLVLAGCSSSTGPDESASPYPDIDGIVVFYPFDGNYENETSDAHDGTPSRAVTFVADRHGQADRAVHVEKVDYVLVPDDPELDITDAITIAAWVNPEASDQALAGLVFKNHDEAYCLAMWGGIADPETTKIIVHITDHSASTDYMVPMGMDVWSHIAFTYDGTTSRIRFYFNGAKVDSGLLSGLIGVSDDDLYFGYGPGGGGYKGKIDEVAIFDRVLTASEITELYSF